ncbi:hypothetical protein [Luteolibacter yonseiensis]|nr:hypothetical protein [Luteolibacter yonseiensis]
MTADNPENGAELPEYEMGRRKTDFPPGGVIPVIRSRYCFPIL